MPASDAMVVGQPVVSGSYFAEPSFQDRFTALDFAHYSDKTWPTDIGLSGQWHENWVPNQETEKYTSRDNPPPDGWSPFTITGDGLRIRAEEVPSAADHVAWSLMKKYDPTDDNKIKTTDDYPGYPNFTVPWLPNTPIEGVDYQLEPYEGKQRVLWLKYGQRWRSGILTTRDDRVSFNQGRIWFVAKVPKGAENDMSGNRSWRHRSCAFCALWIYQMIRRNRGKNNEPRVPGLYQYNDSEYGTLDEIDVLESGSYRTERFFHAVHIHTGVDHKIQINYQESGQDSVNKQSTATGGDPADNFYVFCLDVTPEKTGFAVGPLGTEPEYVRVVNTRRVMYETQREALLDTRDDRKLILNANGDPIFIGEQTHDDGTPRLPEMQVLLNLAMDGQWLLNLMKSDQAVTPYATLGDGRKYCDLTVKRWGVQPLLNAQFIRPSGEIYMPHTNLTPSTINYWDDLAVSAPFQEIVTGEYLS